MDIVKPVIGAPGWGPVLNAALTELDERTGSGTISALTPYPSVAAAEAAYGAGAFDEGALILIDVTT